MSKRFVMLTLAAVTGCGRLGFEPGRLDGNTGDTVAISDAIPDAALCPVVDDHFDTALGPAWVTYISGGATSPMVTNGEVVLDIPTTISSSSLAIYAVDLTDAVVTVTVRSFMDDLYGTQVYLELTGQSGSFYAVNVIPDDTAQGFVLGRIQTGQTFDDLPLAIPTLAAMRLRVATAPDSGGTLVVWSYSPSETAPFVEVRRMIVNDSFAAGDFGAAYQVWSMTASDPPPIQLDDFQFARPCM